MSRGRAGVRRMSKGRYVSYLRVSTARQGRSGLGLEAQQVAIARFCETEGFEITREHVEVETGKGADALDRRPQLATALAEAKRRKQNAPDHRPRACSFRHLRSRIRMLASEAGHAPVPCSPDPERPPRPCCRRGPSPGLRRDLPCATTRG